MKTVSDIIEDIKNNYFYEFTIKPIDEDEQNYTPPTRKNGKQLVLAYCFFGKITTEKLIKRLSNRTDAEVIKDNSGGDKMVMSIKKTIRVLKGIDKDINNAMYSLDTIKDIDKVIIFRILKNLLYMNIEREYGNVVIKGER